MDDVIDDKKFLKSRFGKDPSVGFLMKKRKDYNISNVDDDYLGYLNGIFASSEDDDPDYVLFLNSLKKDGPSYVLLADEKNGLTMPLKYEEDEESDDGDDEDANNLPKIQWMESEPVDEDYVYFLSHIATSGANKFIYEDGCRPPVVYNGLSMEDESNDGLEDMGSVDDI